jgi:hypothetical protein
MTFTVDLELMRAVLKDLGRTDIELPDALDGAKVRVDIPPILAAAYGVCPEFEEARDPDSPRPAPDGDCLALAQMRSPVVSAPPDLNLAVLGEAYLQLLGMTSAEAQALANSVDWTTTLVLPVPRYEAEYQDVTVDGVPGTLVSNPRGYKPQYALLWVKDGIVYALSGAGSAEQALQIANSLK